MSDTTQEREVVLLQLTKRETALLLVSWMTATPMVNLLLDAGAVVVVGGSEERQQRAQEAAQFFVQAMGETSVEEAFGLTRQLARVFAEEDPDGPTYGELLDVLRTP